VPTELKRLWAPSLKKAWNKTKKKQLIIKGVSKRKQRLRKALERGEEQPWYQPWHSF